MIECSFLQGSHCLKFSFVEKIKPKNLRFIFDVYLSSMECLVIIYYIYYDYIYMIECSFNKVIQLCWKNQATKIWDSPLMCICHRGSAWPADYEAPWWHTCEHLGSHLEQIWLQTAVDQPDSDSSGILPTKYSHASRLNHPTTQHDFNTE